MRQPRSHTPFETFLDGSAYLLALTQIACIVIWLDHVATRHAEAVIGSAGMFCAVTALLCIAVGIEAFDKGYSRWFGLLGMLSFVGIVAVRCLPIRRL